MAHKVAGRQRVSLRFGLAVGIPLVAVATLLVVALMPQQNSSMAAAQARLQPAPIDGDRAFGYLKTICALGPRPAGSAANTQQRELVAKHFEKLGAEVREQPFPAQDPLTGAPVAMANLIGSWFPDRTDRVIIAAHYDTRPFPDRDPDPNRRRAAFIGANDGASGVALLMELANHLEEDKTPWGVDLVLFDGEELVYNENGEYFLGSKAFAQAYKNERKQAKKGTTPKRKYVAGFVVDMIGDRELTIDQEQHSLELAPGLVREIWTIAQRLNARGFRRTVGQGVLDDHLALNDADIPTIDLIDFDYPHWHTSQDLPEQCSGASLAQVGRVLSAWLALPKPKPRRR